jgi:hypothetical protein
MRAMYLVQILLPIMRNDGQHQPRRLFDDVRRELVQRHGGLTAYTRAPAEGMWQQDDAAVREQVVIFEVMVDALDEPWWTLLRQRLEASFEQQEIVMRALSAVKL